MVSGKELLDAACILPSRQRLPRRLLAEVDANQEGAFQFKIRESRELLTIYEDMSISGEYGKQKDE